MANSWINLYKNNPTAGAQDGTAISTDDTFTAPLTFPLDASKNESAVQKCAIRTETGYVTYGSTSISDLNDTDDRFKLCKTENGTFTDSITFDEPITDVNKIFYVQGGSSSTENPKTDRSVKLRVFGHIAAAV